MNNNITLNADDLFSQGILVDRLIGGPEVRRFLDRFRAHYLSVELIRVGAEGDGGYLVPNIMDAVSHCFSPGVDYTANFESELSKSYGIRSFLADASVASAPNDDPNFSFTRKFLGDRDEGDFITLSSWMNSNVSDIDTNLILQMDIEGAEYNVLVYEPIEILKRFCCMVIEFHWFDRIFDKVFFGMASGIFEKIYQEFSICHVHPNNCCGIASFDGIDVPRVFEVTFVRKDFAEQLYNGRNVVLPHQLDRKNVRKNTDIAMPKMWWKSDSERI